MVRSSVFTSKTGFSFDVGSPDVWLRDVTLDAGTLMDSFLGDTLATIKDIIAPMRPVVDLLLFEIDLGVAQLQFIDMAYLKLPAKTVDDTKKVLEVIQSTIEFIDSISTVDGMLDTDERHTRKKKGDGASVRRACVCAGPGSRAAL